MAACGLNPLVSTQFNFADVGVNVDMLPKVHNGNEVSMHIELEISNVSGRVDIGGVSQPIISQKKIVHDIRIREGEVNLLGGLMQTQDTQTIAGIPGLAEHAGPRPLFRHRARREEPRRTVDRADPARDPRSRIQRMPTCGRVAAGNDQNVKLNYCTRPAGSRGNAGRSGAPAAATGRRPPARTEAAKPAAARYSRA